MSKRKFPPTQVDELFELKTKLVSESVKKTIKLHDFIKKIEDQEKKIKAIVSPKLELEVLVTVNSKAEGDGWSRTKIPSEPRNQETFSTLGKTILEDDATADFSIRCDTKEFRVHRSILCARSPVFRASILTPMVEAAKGEIFVKDLGEKTLATILHYVYTGELELSEDSNIVELTWGGNKYLLPGFMELLGFRLQMMKQLKGKMVADLLIAAYRHGAEDLRKIALDRIRADREIISDEAFRKEMEMQRAPLSLMMDIIKDL